LRNPATRIATGESSAVIGRLPVGRRGDERQMSRSSTAGC
jgi:hypothetical protein